MKRIGLFIFGIFICVYAYAQTETTKWYIDGQLYATTSCESGGDITPPSVSEQVGYTFTGWEPAIYDMSTLDPTINGSTYRYDRNTHEWSVSFSYGTLYGESLCSPTSENIYIQNDNGGLDTSTGTGQYCWCRLKEFIPINSNKIYEPHLVLWVYVRDLGGNLTDCSNVCGDVIRTNKNARKKIFGS